MQRSRKVDGAHCSQYSKVDAGGLRALPPTVVEGLNSFPTPAIRLASIPMLGHRIGNDVPTLYPEQGSVEVGWLFQPAPGSTRDLHVNL